MSDRELNRRMRTREAAAYCGLAHRTLEKFRLTGEGPAYLKVGRAVIYDSNDLEQWLVSKRRRSTCDQGSD